MILLLIRHAQSAGNAEGRLQGQTETPLTALGRRQAESLARRLDPREWPLAAVYASDLGRAVETAEIVAARHGLPVLLDEKLREYDPGVLSGVIWRDVEHLHPDIWQARYERNEWVPIPGEEGRAAFQGRLSAAIAGIRATHTDEEMVALVSHGGSLGAILAHLLGLDTQPPLPFHFDNASLSIVEFRQRGPVLTRQNDTCHLDGDLR